MQRAVSCRSVEKVPAGGVAGSVAGGVERHILGGLHLYCFWPCGLSILVCIVGPECFPNTSLVTGLATWSTLKGSGQRFLGNKIQQRLKVRSRRCFCGLSRDPGKVRRRNRLWRTLRVARSVFMYLFSPKRAPEGLSISRLEPRVWLPAALWLAGQVNMYFNEKFSRWDSVHLGPLS